MTRRRAGKRMCAQRLPLREVLLIRAAISPRAGDWEGGVQGGEMCHPEQTVRNIFVFSQSVVSGPAC